MTEGDDGQPAPSRAELLSAFAEQLRDLRLAAGQPSLDKLQDRDLRRATISDNLNGKTNPTIDFVLRFVRACAARARAANLPLAAPLVNEEIWRDRWLDLQRRLGARPPSDDALAEDQRISDPGMDLARADLARVVRTRWDEEAMHRALDPPGPITVTWAAARPDLAAHDEVLDRLRTRPARRRASAPRSGRHEDILDLFRQAPCGQLVILGKPGAGKTALAVLLIRGLLSRSRPPDPVPVMVTLTEWDPVRDHLWDWFTRRLERDYPALTDHHRYGHRIVARLLADRLILPVLDGLDEMPRHRHAAAIAALRSVAGHDRPFVLTCRTLEYQDALDHVGRVLPTAVVVEIAPVAPTDAFTYLRHHTRPGDIRWDGVFTDVTRHPDGPAATALSTPLIIWLADLAYGAPPADPGALLDAARFPDRESVENHLIDLYLPAVYPRQPTRAGSEPPVADLDQATRWLTFLAEHLARRGSRDFAWWGLFAELSRWARRATGFAVGAFAALIAFSVIAHDHAMSFATAVAVVVALPVGIVLTWVGPPPEPARLQRRLNLSWRAVFQRGGPGLLAGLVGGIGVTPLAGPIFGAVLVGLGVLLGFALLVINNPDPLDAAGPRDLRRGDGAVLRGLILFGLMIGGLGGLFAVGTGMRLPAWLGAGLATMLVGGFLGSHLAQSRSRTLTSARRLGLRLAVATAIGGVTLGGLGVAAGTLASDDFAGGSWIAFVAVCYGLFFSLMGGLAWTATPWYAVAVLRLSMRGLTPRRLMRFLDDAHRRGVLRQAGATYQFRHAKLQDRLATRKYRVD